MRINNPVKFTRVDNANSADNALVTAGEVNKILQDFKDFSIFKEEFSADGQTWHEGYAVSDNFVRYSFDGGNTWQIRSSYQGDTFILLKNGQALIDFPQTNESHYSGSFLLTGENQILGNILSSIISSENIPSFVLDTEDPNSNIAYDFCSTRNNR